MSAVFERRLERILELMENLAFESSRGVPIVVEGIKDVKALNTMDIDGDIIQAKSSCRSILNLISEIERRGKSEVILLFDFDRRGREWTKILVEHLERMGIKPNTVFWRELISLVGRDVKDVEGLSTYIRTLRMKAGRL